MLFSTVFAALIAVVAATPVMEKRACAAGRGPFYIQGFGKLKQSGNFFNAYAPSAWHPLVLGVPPAGKARATKFYLDSSNSLYTVANGQNFYAVDANLNDPATSQVESTNAAGAGPRTTCTINAATCALSCSSNGLHYNCLGSAGYQPDWRLVSGASAAGPGCVPFTMKAVPA